MSGEGKARRRMGDVGANCRIVRGNGGADAAKRGGGPLRRNGLSRRDRPPEPVRHMPCATAFCARAGLGREQMWMRPSPVKRRTIPSPENALLARVDATLRARWRLSLIHI